MPLIVIPARLASTRLPRKPLADIAGKAMIARVWERAAASGQGEVVVATDSKDIAHLIEQAGGVAVMTSREHVSGSDRIWEAVQKIDAAGAQDIIINLQGDMPTFDPKILRSVLEPFKDPQVQIATLAAIIDDEAEKHDPAVVKPVVAWGPGTRLGRALYFTRATAPAGDGPIYHHVGIYAYRRAALAQFVALPPSPLEQREKLEQLRALEAGMTIGVALIDKAPIGVDTEETLQKARRWYEQQH